MDTDTATQEGVVEGADPAGSAATDEQIERAPTAREQAMEQIHANRMEALAAEVAESGGDGGGDVDEQLERQVGGVLDDAALAATKVRVKVDGEESEVSIEDLRRSYQKDAAATKRLDEASRLLREARETQERAAAAAAPPAKAADAGTGDAPPVKDEEPNARAAVRGALDALLEGDEDKATDLLAGAVEQIAGQRTGEGRGDAATLDPDAIARQVKQELEQDSALAKFATDYQEIVSDPYLAELADRHLAAELKSGKHKTFGDALNASGGKVRDWMKERGLAVSKQTSPTTDLGQRRERKATLDSVSGAAVRSTSAEAPPATTSSVIAEMRQARGQA